MQKVILASQSPQRKIAMDPVGIPFLVIPADIDEKAIQESDQIKRAEFISRAKAEKVQAENQDSVVIAADTFTLVDGIAYEKPESMEEAVQMLHEQSAKSGSCLTGVCYLDPKNNIDFSTTVVTDFLFRELSSAEVKQYVTNNPVLTWSGAFCPAYPAGANLIASTTGSFTSFTHGLPMEVIIPLLKKSGALHEGS